MSVEAQSAPAPAIPSDPAPANPYDAVPYSVCAFPQTRPDRLATTAMLFGMQPAPPDRCRVLELGCASGGNLIPMALGAPGSQFVGIDLSQRQIEEGQTITRELGLANLELHTASILDIHRQWGLFDYILVHGVYSWVPPEVQEKILSICNENLAPQGVAYISYNAYPGWHARGAVREMLWYHTRHMTDPVQRIRAARGMMQFLAASTVEDKSPATAGGGYGLLMRQELALLKQVPDTYLLHEHLEEYNEPLYFHQFAQRAAEKGLQYLGEAHIGSMVAGKFGPEIEKTLRQISPDLLHMEQYMDFLRNRMFRQTLLCHEGIKLDYALKPEIVKGLYIASSAKPTSAEPDFAGDKPEQFRGPGQATLTTRDPLMKAAMICLAESWPMPIRFDELVAASKSRLESATSGAETNATSIEGLPTRILNCFTSGLIELSMSPPCFTTKISEKPVASPYARLRAKTDEKLVNYRLEPLLMRDPSRLILRHLDGEHDMAALVAILVQWLKTQPLPANAQPNLDGLDERATRYLQILLAAFARGALLSA